MNEKTKTLEERSKDWESVCKKSEEITYGMLCDGFQSISGIPDNFYSAEDPADRGRLWDEYRIEYEREQCRISGRCWRCGMSGCGVCD